MTVLCDIRMLIVLVENMMCPACHDRKVVIWELAERHNGLPSFLELHCENDDALHLFFRLHTVHSTLYGVRGSNGHYDAGTSCNTSAINLKAVLATRAIGAGYDQLSRFYWCGILGRSLFHDILHDSALDASAYTADSVGNKLGIVPEMLLTVYAYQVPICLKSHESNSISESIT